MDWIGEYGFLQDDVSTVQCPCAFLSLVVEVEPAILEINIPATAISYVFGTL